MLYLYRESEGVEISVGCVPPGAVGSYGEATNPAGRLIVFSCYDHDSGGEVRTMDRDVYLAHVSISFSEEDLLDTELLSTIPIFGRVRLPMLVEGQRSGFFVAHHIPGHYN